MTAAHFQGNDRHISRTDGREKCSMDGNGNPNPLQKLNTARLAPPDPLAYHNAFLGLFNEAADLRDCLIAGVTWLAPRSQAF